MVIEFLGGGRIRQCEQARAAFGNPTGTTASSPKGIPNNCCDDDGVLVPGSDCDRQWYPQFDKWGFDAVLRNEDPLSWDELTNEINEGRPFLFSWAETPPVNHMMVAIGYHEDLGDQMVFYIDPLKDPVTDSSMARFDQYNGTSNEDGEYQHRDDYFWIQPSTLP